MFRFFAAAIVVVFLSASDLRAAQMAMGFRVGEVTQNSAIIWTRITRDDERNWEGHREPMKREPRIDEYVPSAVKVEERHGESVGASGEVRVVYGTAEDLSAAKSTAWAKVTAQGDFVHQFRLSGLEPGTRYHLRVEARDTADEQVSATRAGSFGTAAAGNVWQNVTFTVVTGQSYWDLDHRNGYQIYPSMHSLKPDFLVATGDTVYMDSEAPRARTIPLARFHWHRMYSLPRHIEFHRTVPGYWEVDDHDSWCNDCWPTMKADWMKPLTFEQGFKVYREQVPIGENLYRTVRWGKGLQIWLVEGRKYRSSNRMPDGPEKTIWGKEQLSWLQKSVLASDASFRVLISPTPIVGPDRGNKADNHANKAFTHEGDLFRNWTREQNLKNFFVCCGDRHWQYLSIDPATKLHEFSCGPASDKHAGGSPGRDAEVQPFHREKGGFLSVAVEQQGNVPTIFFRHHGVDGKVHHEFKTN